MSKKDRKKSGEELQGFLEFRRRGYYVKNKKGKASYDRARFNKIEEEQVDEGEEAYKEHLDIYCP